MHTLHNIENFCLLVYTACFFHKPNINGYTEIQTYKQPEIQTDGMTDGWKDGQRDRWMDKHWDSIRDKLFFLSGLQQIYSVIHENINCLEVQAVPTLWIHA